MFLYYFISSMLSKIKNTIAKQDKIQNNRNNKLKQGNKI